MVIPMVLPIVIAMVMPLSMPLVRLVIKLIVIRDVTTMVTQVVNLFCFKSNYIIPCLIEFIGAYVINIIEMSFTTIVK